MDHRIGILSTEYGTRYYATLQDGTHFEADDVETVSRALARVDWQSLAIGAAEAVAEQCAEWASDAGQEGMVVQCLEDSIKQTLRDYGASKHEAAAVRKFRLYVERMLA